MARSQEPKYTCHTCGNPIFDILDAASSDYDYIRSTRWFPIYGLTCWGCAVGEDDP